MKALSLMLCTAALAASSTTALAQQTRSTLPGGTSPTTATILTPPVSVSAPVIAPTLRSPTPQDALVNPSAAVTVADPAGDPVLVPTPSDAATTKAKAADALAPAEPATTKRSKTRTTKKPR